MKVYVQNPPLSLAMNRVSEALTRFAPRSVQLTQHEGEADLVLLHVIGYPETVEKIEQLKARGKQYGIIQYCMRSTQRPNTQDWLPIWHDAEIVWSYYDLPKLVREDKIEFALDYNFYFAPLGADGSKFRPWATPKRYIIGTSGRVAESECILEAAEAAKIVGQQMFHLGPKDDRYGDHVVCIEGMNDAQLGQLYSRCVYVAGLRRAEGFELPAAEGLLCGARPICFDRPHYRQWYGDHALYIPEDGYQETVEQLIALFRERPPEITQEERDECAELFNWERIASGFWQALLPHAPVAERGTQRRTLLWCGDACVSSGFARATHGVLEHVRSEWDVYVLGLNYWGDPHCYPYTVYPTHTVDNPYGDYLGIQRIGPLIRDLRPDLVMIQNDPWHFPMYMKAIGNTPCVGVVAVDGMNCRGNELNGLKHAIFWTAFGEREAKRGGYGGTSSVIPLGVDLNVYKPQDKAHSRMACGLQERHKDVFIVGNVNRNQPRKRLDLTISFFAEWVLNNKISDAYLFLHVAPTRDVGYDCEQLMRYYGIAGRLIYAEPEVGQGVSERCLVDTYNSFDVLLSTTQGEGWGLPTQEAMACGIPCVVPDWSAHGDWARDAAWLIPCVEITCTPNDVNAIGGVPSRSNTIAALDKLYREPSERKYWSEAGMRRAAEPQFRWESIGAKYLHTLDSVLRPQLTLVGG